MIAKLWGDKIINNQKTYMQVPRLLKERVADYLILRNREDLIIE